MGKVKNIYSQIYIDSAKKLGLKYKIDHPLGLVSFYYKNRKTSIFMCLTQANDSVAAAISGSKSLCHAILKKDGIPVPCQKVFNKQDKILKHFSKIPFPLVVKPNKGYGGKGVSIFIQNKKELKTALANAFTHSPKVIVEQYFKGVDYRFLVIGPKVVAVLKRSPPLINGNNRKTVAQLISEKNLKRTKENQKKHKQIYSQIPIDQELKRVLKIQKLTLDSVLAKKQTIALRMNANYSTGGTTTIIKLKDVHPENLNLAIKTCQAVNLKIAGVDILCRDVKIPLINNKNGLVIEINHMPGLRIHHFPTHGKSQNVAAKILKYLLKMP